MSNTKYLIRGERLFLQDDSGLPKTLDKLGPHNYMIGINKHGEWYLERIPDFSIPEKIYGNVLNRTDRIINTFQSRDSSTGVLLTGEKGSGKSLLAKNVAVKLQEAGYPTIVVNSAFCGDAFNRVLQRIEQKCVVLFDEFEKVYSREAQESLLSLFDGFFDSKKLFVLTSNDTYKVIGPMKNRPGRLYYKIDYKNLPESTTREYCEENLHNTSYVGSVLQIVSMVSSFNFDMLKALVEEMNRYDESPAQALDILNINSYIQEKRYDVVAYHPDYQELKPASRYMNLGDDMSYSFYAKKKTEGAEKTKLEDLESTLQEDVDDVEDEYKSISFNMNSLQSFKDGFYHFVATDDYGEEWSVRMCESHIRSFNIRDHVA